MFKNSAIHCKYIWMLLFVYVLSKVAEHFDTYIYNLTNEISGHTMKHLLASLGIFIFYLHFAKRRKTADA